MFAGGVPERSKGADCKSAGSAFEGSNPSPSTTSLLRQSGAEDRRNPNRIATTGGCSSMVEQKPSKLTTRVRFPSPAPELTVRGTVRSGAPVAQRRVDKPHGATRVDRHSPARHMARLPTPGQVAEWLKAADCKSARASVRWFESSPVHHTPSERRRRLFGVAIEHTRRYGQAGSISVCRRGQPVKTL